MRRAVERMGAVAASVLFAFTLDVAPVVSAPHGAGDCRRVGLDELCALTEQLEESDFRHSKDLDDTLPVWAHRLDRLGVGVRGTLVRIDNVDSGHPAWSHAPDDLVYTFRMSEAFYWRGELFDPPAVVPADSLVRFRIGGLFVNMVERRSHGRTRPIVLGHEYFVATRSLMQKGDGSFIMDQVLPIQGDAVIIDYATLFQDRAGQLLQSPATLELPLVEYRRCLATPPRPETLVKALWRESQNPDRTHKE